MQASHAPSISRSPTPLVGRVRERLVLHDELVRAAGGVSRLVLIGGEAGIGKTSLVRDLGREAATRQVTVLTGHCYDLTATPPYGPWIDLFATYRSEGGLPPAPVTFAGEQMRPIEHPAALIAEIRAFLAQLTAESSAVMILEDFHWADPASVELLRGIAIGEIRLPLLVALTYRADELPPRAPLAQHLASLINSTGGTRLDLRQLDLADLRELIRARWTLSHDDEERLAAHLAERSDGNPFFATEMLRAMGDAGLVTREGETDRLGSLEALGVPRLLRQVIDTRVQRLGEATRRALAIASIIGQEVPLDLWSALAGDSEERIFEALETSAGASLMDPAADGTRAFFVHALTREALYESMLPPRRRVLHRQLAELLMARPNPDPDAIASHLREAGDPRAAEWLIAAGERAQRAYALFTAAERFEAAAEMLESDPARAQTRGWLLYRTARMLRFGATDRALPLAETSYRLGEQAGNQVLAAEASYSTGLMHLYLGDLARGLEQMVAGIARLSALTPDVRRANQPALTWMADSLPERDLAWQIDSDVSEAFFAASGTHHRTGSFPWWQAVAGSVNEAIRDGERFTSAAEAFPQSDVLLQSATGHAYQGLGNAYATLGRVEEARAAFARAREWYVSLDHHAVIAFSWLYEQRDVVMPYLTADLALRARIARETELELARAGGALPPSYPPAVARLPSMVLAGRWDEALGLIADIPPPANMYFRRELIESEIAIRIARGEWERGQRLIDEVLPLGTATEPGSRQLMLVTSLFRAAAAIYLDRGAFARAAEWLAAHDRWLSWSGAVPGRSESAALWARLTLDRAEPGGEALVYARIAVAHAREPHQPRALTEALAVLGRVQRALGDWDAAGSALEESMRGARAMRSPFHVAEAAVALGDVFAARGDFAAARAHLDEGLALAEELGVGRLVTAAESLGHSIAIPELRPAGLTAREREVLELVAQGLTDAAVGEQLFISPRTVGQHLRSIYAKLDVPSRAAATRYAIEHDLL